MGANEDAPTGFDMMAFAALALHNRFGRSAGTILLAASLAAGAVVPVLAGDGQSRIAAKEANLTLAAEPAGADGIVRGALLIDLAAGWHTYWRDPGASGIPPTLDFSGTKGFGEAVLHFAAPQRFGSDLTRGNGYTEATAIAFALTPKQGETIGTVDARIFLGVCREICIPVQAELTVASPAEGDPRVEAAFAALPSDDGSRGRIASATMSPDASSLTITTTYANAPSKPDLFVTGSEGWFFDEPAKTRIDGTTATFTVLIVERPPNTDKTAAPATIDIVATDGETAFEADGFGVSAKADALMTDSKRP